VTGVAAAVVVVVVIAVAAAAAQCQHTTTTSSKNAQMHQTTATAASWLPLALLTILANLANQFLSSHTPNYTPNQQEIMVAGRRKVNAWMKPSAIYVDLHACCAMV